MKTELRLTDTNAASDSKGRTWGLEGGLFWWLVGGIGAGITGFFVALVILKSSLLTSVGVVLIPIGLCLAYIFGLRQGKPPSDDRDIFERVFTGSGFAPESIRLTHPLGKEQPGAATSLSNSIPPTRRCTGTSTVTISTRPHVKTWSAPCHTSARHTSHQRYWQSAFRQEALG